MHLDLGSKIVFLDEAVFTFNTFATRAWSAKNSNIEVNDQLVKVKTLAIVAASSLDNGIDHYLIYPKSIKTNHFLLFL